MNEINKNKVLDNIQVLNRIEIGKEALVSYIDETGKRVEVRTDKVIDYYIGPNMFKIYTLNGDYKATSYEFIQGRPLNKYEYTSNIENAGYRIESRIFADDGINYVLAYNEKNRYGSNFVTWIENTYSEEVKYDGGHYFDTREEAIKDLLLRVDMNKSVGLRSHFMQEIFKEDLQAILSINYEEEQIQEYMSNPEFVDVVFDEWLSVGSTFVNQDGLIEIIQDQIQELDERCKDHTVEMEY